MIVCVDFKGKINVIY